MGEAAFNSAFALAALASLSLLVLVGRGVSFILMAEGRAPAAAGVLASVAAVVVLVALVVVVAVAGRVVL